MDLDQLAARLAGAALDRATQRRTTPVATYRLQMNASFTFRDAAGQVPYLHRLGISHLYLSPVLNARRGSSHGYDVIDPSSFNPEVGTEEEFRDLVRQVRQHGMGLILDVVPNHMFLGSANPWWRDIFEHGPSSPYASYFDIAWDDPPRAELRGRLMLPLLGSPYWKALEAGELRLVHHEGKLSVAYFDHELPVDPRTYGRLLRPMLERLSERAGADAVAVLELQSILTAIKHLPDRRETDPGRIREGRAECEVVKRRLADLIAGHAEAAASLTEAVTAFAGQPGDPASYRALEELLDEQAYHLCYWRVASDEVNYRRFFDVNELSALAAEQEPVFLATHDYLLRLCGSELVDGLRIDHPDGLYDPVGYLDRLQWHYLLACARHRLETDPEFSGVEWAAVREAVAEHLRRDRPTTPLLYVVVEKILSRGERLPDGWPTDGTVGYEALNVINGLFVDPAGERPLTDLFEQFTDRSESFAEIAYRQKWLVLQSSFSSELGMLGRQLDRLARQNRQARDFTLNGLRRALRAVIASFPVYRTYVTEQPSTLDETVVRLAVRRARMRNPTLNQDLFDYIRDTLLLRSPTVPVPEGYTVEQRAFAGKFQQVTGPVTAKGLEDTAFYVYNRLLSLNEVGGDPGRFGWSVADAHRFFTDRQAHFPGGLTAGATHDTKRGEDVRARLNVLSERADEWSARVRHWAELNRPHRVELDDGLIAPDPSEELLLYQTLVGAWPDEDDAAERDAFPDRLRAYLWKAIHEAKLHTSWINPSTRYEEAVRQFLDRLLDPTHSAAFLDDLRGFQRQVRRHGILNGLAQSLIHCLAPGVPDIYQGSELWDLSLVDPDNRRPVDFAGRADRLAALDMQDAGPSLEQLLEHPDDGRAKLYVLARALRYRRDRAALFARGAYVPVQTGGARADHVFAFLRAHEGQTILVVVPRLVGSLLPADTPPPPADVVWQDTRLHCPAECRAARWKNGLTGEELPIEDDTLALSRVFARFPVAFLEAVR